LPTKLEKVPFQVSMVFDLASEIAAKARFAPVETVLTAAGFAVSETKFQRTHGPDHRQQ
jgi:hypothetical protein